MKFSKGFSLLEVVLALAISLMLTTLLFQTLSQSNVVLSKVMNITDIERKVTIVHQLFDREISGIFIPKIVWDPSVQEADESGEGAADKNKLTQDASEQKKDMNVKKDDEEQEKIQQPFVYKADAMGNLIMFTFITTNPSLVYDQPQARMIRVMYRLEPDSQNPEQYILMHQQSEFLDPKKFIPGSYNAVRGYPVLNGIKSFQVEFVIEKPEPKKDDDKKDDDKKQQDNQKKERQFETLKEWKEEVEQKDFAKDQKSGKADLLKDKKDEQKRPALPTFIHITFAIYDERKNLRMYDYWFAPLYDMQSSTNNKLTGLASDQVMENNQKAMKDNQQIFDDIRSAEK